MPGAGSGTGTPVGSGVAPSTTPAAIESSCVTLSRYCELIGHEPNAFWGVARDDLADVGYNTSIWTEPQRLEIARLLSEAQEEIEQVVGYPICLRWFEDEQHPYKPIVHTNWRKVVSVGVKATSVIAAGSAIDHTNDPAVVGPIATTVTDTSEVHVYYPGSDREITPQTLSISGGLLTIWIPRCRLVDPDKLFNPVGGLDYDVIANFLGTVDVEREYLSVATQATLVWPHKQTDSCDCTCGCRSCSEYTHAGCEYIRNSETGAIDVLHADYMSGAWSASCDTCYCTWPEFVRLNYRAGLTTVTRQAEDAIVRLAHAKAPEDMCSSDSLQRLFKRDREIPPVLDSRRLACPFGINNGSWVAYKFAMALKVGECSVL